MDDWGFYQYSRAHIIKSLLTVMVDTWAKS